MFRLSRLIGLIMMTGVAGPATAVVAEDETTALLGAIVFDVRGAEVGEVAAFELDGGGEVGTIDIAVARVLGLGARRIALPRDTFIILRGAVRLELTAEEIKRLPHVAGD